MITSDLRLTINKRSGHLSATGRVLLQAIFVRQGTRFALTTDEQSEYRFRKIRPSFEASIVLELGSD